MSDVLAVDWDSTDLRCLLASTRGKKLKIQMATTVPLVNVSEAGGPQVRDIAGSLRSALDEQRIGRATVLVAVDRASVELFNFTLPPATDAELPTLVHNQAIREAAHLSEGSALDFVPLSDDPSEPRPVAAAILAPERRKAIEEICEAANLTPSRIVLRPFVAATYFVKTFSPPEQSCLLVNLLADEVDLTSLVRGRSVLVRTARIPQDVSEEESARWLLAEITRTLVVAQQGPGGPTERIYLFGGPGEHQVLVDMMADMTIPVTVLDPFEGVDGSGVELPGNAGRFASLLGMVQDEACDTHSIDFLHPRQPPRARDWRRPAALVAGLLALAAVAGCYLYWDTYSSLADTTSGLAEERKTLDDAVKRSREQTQLHAQIREWQNSEIVWLDELRELSQRLPSSRDLLVHRMTISGRGSAGGVIELQGVVRDAAIIAAIDRGMHDEFHTVSSKRVGELPQNSAYSWLFERTITVAPRDKSLYQPAEPEKP